MASDDFLDALATSHVQDPLNSVYSAWSQSAPFEYCPLWRKGTIRVLHLLPGASKDPILCEIEHVSLDEGVEYNALSYAWGDPGERVAISVFGHGFQVTASLAEALRAFRKRQKTVPVWADAVCINQTDPAERAEQVGRMRDVYANARQVIVWLGNGSAMSELGLTVIRKANTLPVEEWNRLVIETKGEARFLKMILHGLMDIFGRSWWSRV
ncbi:hypothetical protein A1O7_07530 [Cladophialophora yegresii CBS 114405]|uniref:Heterokaryon incompatibility domain-containing protein n=1 Tax=Cladophialophora yegresii CBS 114405 TaxID=1182544 RepID=W9VNR5_9EURO|nr:uncharacterized protein A1O7_07530 [Cladophialophora yegresii CBS 114405]EXJ57183.1 hypothetical protein A1O7_07530 [Cladophialophora yegresii CBS 114405]